MTELEKLKYPVGKFERPLLITKEILSEWIDIIDLFPQKIKKEVEGLTDEQLDTPYRDGGWTVRQVVHHCADSYMNSLMRFKLALTEDKPTIKPYLQARWAELSDTAMPVEVSLKILEGIHARWIFILNRLSDSEMERTFIHPEHNKESRIDETIGMYAWHCRHHLAHITNLKMRKSWK